MCALAAAGATGLDAGVEGRDRGVMLESLQDTFRHLLVDGPNAMGSAPCPGPVATARFEIASSARAIGGVPRHHDGQKVRGLAMRLSALAAEAIFGMPVARWRELADVDALLDWCAQRATVAAVMLGDLLADEPTLGRSAIPLMPPAQGDLLRRIVVPAMHAEPEFPRAPTWEGHAVETGALARMRHEPLVAAVHGRFGNAVVTRIVARLAELALLLQELDAADVRSGAPPRIQGMPLGDGEGLAAVETARGLLLHRARLRDGRVVDYRIVAPTEWNFHPDGALPRGLEGCDVADERQLLRAVRLAVHALDPCVACRIEVGHA
jgi:hypothetical protein